MNFLIDTHILLWHLTDNPRLSTEKSQLIEDLDNIKFFSIASLWKIAIKQSIGKLNIDKTIQDIIPFGIITLDIKIPHIVLVKDLPFHHRDPFDRMIIAQAISENLKVLTDDKQFKKYDITIL